MQIRHVWPIPKIEYRSFTEIDDPRPIILVTSPAAWKAVGSSLRLNVAARLEPNQAEAAYWDGLMADTRGEAVYAVGGGLAADTAKYVAVKKGLPLVCLPTALSVDAFFTWASGVRRDGSVYYIETKPPDHVVIDLETIGQGPAAIRAAGICDVLSIATGLWDWRYAEAQEFNPPHAKLIPWAAQAAEAILQGALDCAEGAGRGDRDGLKQLVDCLAMEVQLCNLLGHSRPEEGSEHYFAYAVENAMGKGLPHGDLVGPGILLMAKLQEQETEPLKRALESCNIPLGNIPAETVAATLRSLPEFCRKHNLMHGLAHDIIEPMVERAME